jgi:hypothetical protein
MTKTEVLAFFDNSPTAVARFLGISQPSVTNWPEELPILRQLELERLTGGKLRAGPECDRFRVEVKAT